MAEKQVDFELYRYTPSQIPAGLFAGLFFLTTLYHIYQVYKARAWFFLVFVLGGIFQVIGYITRIPANDNQESVPIFAIHTLLILLAPPLYAASIYMVLGRLITFLGAERLSLVRVKWMTAIFVTGDVIAFLAQAAGGGIMAGGSVDDFERGEKITIGGLGVQLAFFGGFMITCASFHYRIRKSPTPEATSLASRVRGKRMRSWETILVGLYIASILILVRSIFRLVEYVQGNDGYLISHEVFMYVFDSSLMFITMVVMNICHPSMVLSESQKERDVEIGSLASSVGQRS